MIRTHNYEGNLRITPKRIVSAAVRRAKSSAIATWLGIASHWDRLPLTEEAGRCVLSLTSHGARLDHVHQTLQRLARGRERPRRVILVVDSDELTEALASRPLRRMLRRGLEVVEGQRAFGPHNKYFFAVPTAIEMQLPLVTADDDVIYPRSWLSHLLEAHDGVPSDIIAYRCRQMVTADGGLAPYRKWPLASEATPVAERFLTGVSGVLYPQEMLSALREAGDQFLATCARADDIWLNAVAMRAGVSIRLVQSESTNFPTLPGTQRTSLVSANAGRDQNDVQIEATFAPAELVDLARSIDPRLGDQQ